MGGISPHSQPPFITTGQQILKKQESYLSLACVNYCPRLIRIQLFALFLYQKLGAASRCREVSEADYHVLANCVVDVTDQDPHESTRYGADSFQKENYSETELAESVSTTSRMCGESHNPPRKPLRNQFKSSKNCLTLSIP